ncbi:hypothetical protein BC829DRAFT_151680 [Chytridium lagenaria]|nr:hypothetical protein BC829DRAFT_151680 [Chytridium lagenaria]
MKKVINLTDKEELILRLTAEKTKMEQKCSISNKLVHASAGHNSNLKRQSEKQLEQIRKLEEREKSLVQQLQTIEKDFSTKTIAADLHRRKVSELTQKNAELTDRAEKLSIKYQEVEKLLKEKNKALVDESDSKRRLLEQAEILKQRLEKQAKAEPAGESSSLQREYEALKQTFKCPSCRTNFGLTFFFGASMCSAKVALTIRLIRDPRKCPSCSAGFSSNEITKLFLP